MDPGDRITIEEAVNGYLVQRYIGGVLTVFVFRTNAELIEFIKLNVDPPVDRVVRPYADG